MTSGASEPGFCCAQSGLSRALLPLQGQKKAIAEKIKALEVDPFVEGKTLDRYPPLRRVKAGDARMIYDPEPDANGRLSILVFGTDHSIYEHDELFKEYLREGRR